MAVVEITINGRAFNVTCDDGQEDRLTHLAGEVDARVSDLAGKIGQIGDARLMLLAALTLADDLSEARTHAGGVDPGALDEARREGARLAGDEMEAGAARVIEAAARRINALADSLSADSPSDGA